MMTLVIINTALLVCLLLVALLAFKNAKEANKNAEDAKSKATEANFNAYSNSTSIKALPDKVDNVITPRVAEMKNLAVSTIKEALYGCADATDKKLDDLTAILEKIEKVAEEQGSVVMVRESVIGSKEVAQVSEEEEQLPKTETQGQADEAKTVRKKGKGKKIASKPDKQQG